MVVQPKMQSFARLRREPRKVSFPLFVARRLDIGALQDGAPSGRQFLAMGSLPSGRTSSSVWALPGMGGR